MVSYFIPRGRLLIKAANLKQSYPKQQQHAHQQSRWPMLRHFRQSFSTQKTSTPSTTNHQTETTIIHRNVGKINYKNSKYDRNQIKPTDQKYTIWMKWTRFLLRFTPVGICLFGAIEWQLHKRKCVDEALPRTASNFQTKVYCSLPLRLMSRCWGWLAACYIPIPLRSYIYGWYSSVFHVNMDEAVHPDYKYYNSLSEFFTRSLRAELRPIDKNSPIVSPADGKVLHFGSATNALIEQVKGVSYNIETFLGPPTWINNPKVEANYAEAIKHADNTSTSLYQCVIYLAPGDYHRFHSPTDWQPTLRRHFDGELLSVNPTIATWLPGLFCLNERALYLGKWMHGFFSYTAVGATNVGSVKIYMDENLKTNRWVGFNVGAHRTCGEYQEMKLEDMKLNKGDLIGHFNMGSTIVLLFEAPKNFEFSISAGQKIRVGESLGYIKN